MYKEDYSMKFDFEEVFKDDCVENYNYTQQEADQLWKIHGAQFIDDMMDDLWDNWSENFPVTFKEEERNGETD